MNTRRARGVLGWSLWALLTCGWTSYLLIARDWRDLAIMGAGLLSSGITCILMIRAHQAHIARLREQYRREWAPPSSGSVGR